MENQTFNYKDDRYSIRPQAPPGGATHFNLSDSGYGDKDIHHPYKRNNHPRNDINPPPNFVKREDVIENTPNGAAPVTGNRPSIKLRAPPGGLSSLDYYSSEDNYEKDESIAQPPTITQTEVVYDEPEEKPAIPPPSPKTETQPVNEPQQNPTPVTKQNNKTTFSSSIFNSEDNQSNYRPVYTPQAPPGGKSSIFFGDEEPVATPTKRPSRPNPEFQESSFSASPSGRTSGRRISNQTKQNNQNNFGSSIFNTSEEDNQPYKPYYAPQAPPGGKDSISFGGNDESVNNLSFSGRRRNYNRDHFKSSISFNY